MRNGRLVAQENPDVLLNQYGMLNLEDVFLKLCLESDEQRLNKYNNNSDLNSVQIKQNYCYDNQVINELTKDNIEKQSQIVYNQNLKENNDMSVKISITEEKTIINDIPIKIRSSGFINKQSALLQKDIKQFTRKWFHLLLGVFLSSLVVLFTLLSIGDGPTNMNLAIFDEEKQNNLSQNWGQLFVDSIDKNRFIIHYFTSLEEAVESVELGYNHAAIDINDRFTKAIVLRFNYLTEADEETLSESTIDVHVDQSNQLVALQVEAYLYLAMLNFTRVMANKMEMSPEFFKLPLNFDEAIYPESKGSIKKFVVPGFYLTAVLYISALMTTHNIIVERKDGIFQRSIVAGITASDILSSNIIFQMIVQVFQVTALLSCTYFIMNIPFTGPFLLFLALIFSQGLCGIGLGLMISNLIYDELISTLIVVLLFVISIVYGVFWPIENMPQFMQYGARYLHPSTVPINAMRSIMYRDWGINHFEVYFGFICDYIWFSIFLIIAFILLKKGL